MCLRDLGNSLIHGVFNSKTSKNFKVKKKSRSSYCFGSKSACWYVQRILPQIVLKDPCPNPK